MKSILIIEDDLPLCETTADFLEMSGYKVFKASDGIIGTQIALKEDPDVILCDISMPEISGYDVYQTLQENPKTSVIPFIFVTAKAEADEVRQGMLLGADDYIIKPYNFNKLLESINTRFRKQEKVLLSNDQKFYALIDNSPNAIFVIQNDQIIYINKQFSALTGYSTNEAIGQLYKDFIVDNYKAIVISKVDLCANGFIDKTQINCILKCKHDKTISVDIYCSVANMRNNKTIVTHIVETSNIENNYNLKKSDKQELEDAVSLIINSKQSISNELIKKLIDTLYPSKVINYKDIIKFTKREKEILGLACQGNSNFEIADKLFISYRTVERHRTNLINKLGAKNIIEVIIYAIKNSIIEI